MNGNYWIRWFHRWVSIVFTLAVIITSVALALKLPMAWVPYLPLPPLAVLALTGLYLFALPYFSRRRGMSVSAAAGSTTAAQRE